MQELLDYAARRADGNVAGSLWGADVSELPPQIADRPNIIHLDLNRNLFETFPIVVTELPRLTKLTIGSNYLTSLPPEIGDMPAIQEIDLSANRISELPPEIGQLSTLQKLTIEWNDLTTLPPEIGELDNVTYCMLGITKSHICRRKLAIWKTSVSCGWRIIS